MGLTAKGLIVREHNIGEADRFVTVLTDRFGIIRASVRGARRVNSRAGASTRLLSYASLSLCKGRDKFIVETAVPERVFFATGGTVEQVALAQYFCELFGTLAPREEEAEAYLSLLLNALHLLEKGEHRDRIKAVTELRLLAMAGYRPTLSGCRCGQGEGVRYFEPTSGVLCCDRCRLNGAAALSPTVFDAMRFILQSPPSRCFAFRLPDEACLQLADIAEQFMIAQVSRRFQTLEFYHTVSEFQV